MPESDTVAGGHTDLAFPDETLEPDTHAYFLSTASVNNLIC